MENPTAGLVRACWNQDCHRRGGNGKGFPLGDCEHGLPACCLARTSFQRRPLWAWRSSEMRSWYATQQRSISSSQLAKREQKGHPAHPEGINLLLISCLDYFRWSNSSYSPKRGLYEASSQIENPAATLLLTCIANSIRIYSQHFLEQPRCSDAGWLWWLYWMQQLLIISGNAFTNLWHLMFLYPHAQNETQLSNPINIRHFEAYGVAVHLFIKMSAHRGGPNSFAIVGLEAKEPAALYYNPPYECVWVPAPGSTKRKPIKGHAFKMLPDPENTYSRLYSAVTLNCTFNEDVGIDREGGQLVLYASYGELFPRKSERIVVLTEDAGEFKGMQFYKSDSFEYDCVYCGSPLFGDLSPQRIREWMAYHAHFFGPRSHFFLYDAGGIHEDVRRVLKPWIAAGRITLDDIREQEKYDGYYHNQFMVVNDCFHRARHLSRWLFFFDVDEYMWIPPSSGTLESILAGFEHQTQIIMWQKPMSRSVCLEDENSATDRLERYLTNFENITRKLCLKKRDVSVSRQLIRQIVLRWTNVIARNFIES